MSRRFPCSISCVTSRRKMISHFFVASCVLSGVLGQVCFPDKMKAVSFIAGDTTGYDMLIDYTQNKQITRPSTGNVKYVLNDMANGNSYTRFDDDSCSVAKIATPFRQCIDTSAMKYTSTLAGSLVDSYVIINDKGIETVTVTPQHNLPALLVLAPSQGVVTTQFFLNITSSVDDVSDLSQDISGCQESV